MDAKPRIFFTRSYTYRKPGVLFGGLSALMFGGLPLVWLSLEIPETQWTWGVIGTAVFVGGICGLLAASGAWIVRQWYARTSMLLEISETGVRYGKFQHSWDELHWISGKSEQKSIQLFFQLRGPLVKRGDRAVPVDPGLTFEEFQSLMEELSTALSGRHPNVTFG